jgi:hypothetical protein
VVFKDTLSLMEIWPVLVKGEVRSRAVILGNFVLVACVF